MGGAGRGGAGRPAAKQRGEAGRPSVQGCDQDRAKARPHSTRRRFPPSNPALTRSAALPGSVQPARGAPPAPPSPGAAPTAEGRRGSRRNMAALRAFPGAGPALRSRPRPLLPPEAAQSSRPGEKYHRRSSYTGVDLIKPPPIVYFNIALVTEIIKMDSAASSLVLSPLN